MKCIKEKCPKYEYSFGRYICKLDNSCSQYELNECSAEEFLKEIEKDFKQLKYIYNLVLKSQ